MVVVWITEVDGVRDLVILKLKCDSARGELLLRGHEIRAPGAKCEMQHPNLFSATRGRHRRVSSAEESKGGAALPDKNRHTVPHSFMARFEPKHFNIPAHRSVDVAYGQCNVVYPFQF